MVENETEYMKDRVGQSVNERDMDMPSILSPLDSSEESEPVDSDDPCCVHVEPQGSGESNTVTGDNNATIEAAESARTNDDNSEGKGSAQGDRGTTYHVMGVFSKGRGSYDIYLQSSDAKNPTDFDQYHLSPNSASTLPGYGRILRVEKQENSNSKIPYVVVTEKGEIRGRK